jgi:chromosome segregation ATPase
MNKTIKYFIAAAMVVGMLVVGYRSCTVYDKYSVLKGRYDALAEEYDTQKDNSQAQISHLRNIIAHKDEEIRTITSHILEKEGEISTLHAQTDKLEYAYATLDKKVASVDTLQAKVDNLIEQVNSWKQKFTLAETIIKDLGEPIPVGLNMVTGETIYEYPEDSITFSLNAKYDAQVKISLEWKSMYDNEVVLHNLSEVRRKMSERRIKGLRFGGTIKSGLILTLAGVVIYGLVQ